MKNNMDWAIVAQLIISQGLPLAASIVEKWSKGTPVTPEEMNDLRAKGSELAVNRAKLKLLENGVDLNSDRAKQILALTASVNSGPGNTPAAT